MSSSLSCCAIFRLIGKDNRIHTDHQKQNNRLDEKNKQKNNTGIYF